MGTDISEVDESSYNDTLTAGAGPVTLNGEGGNDTLNGGPGGDTLIGGSGDDTINTKGPFGVGPDSIYGRPDQRLRDGQPQLHGRKLAVGKYQAQVSAGGVKHALSFSVKR